MKLKTLFPIFGMILGIIATFYPSWKMYELAQIYGWQAEIHNGILVLFTGAVLILSGFLLFMCSLMIFAFNRTDKSEGN